MVGLCAAPHTRSLCAKPRGLWRDCRQVEAVCKLIRSTGYLGHDSPVHTQRPSGHSRICGRSFVCVFCVFLNSPPVGPENPGCSFPPPPGKVEKKPKDYPEKYFARFAVDDHLVKMIIQTLQSDDIYLGAESFPSPEHRSTRLSSQVQNT